jgi:hypothetical protein
MMKAGIYSYGACSHRCRDTYADRALAANTPLAVIAAALGDLASTVERYYSCLDSFRMRQRVEEAPVIAI